MTGCWWGSEATRRAVRRYSSARIGAVDVDTGEDKGRVEHDLTPGETILDQDR